MIVNNEKVGMELLRAELSGYSTRRLSRFLKSPLRTVLPRIMRRIGVTRDRTLPLIWGASFCGVLPEAISSVRWRFGYFDPKTTINLLNCLKEGDVFVDVGAHFGYFTLLASSIVEHSGKVIAVEAIPSTFERLRKNIRKNGFEDRCVAVNCAAYHRKTKLEFKDFGTVFSSLNTAFGLRTDVIKSIESVREVLIDARTLDHILEESNIKRVDVIKIDAESSEFYVLQGMQDTLKRYHPTLIVELGDEGVAGAEKSTQDVIDFLRGFGYSANELIGNELIPVPDREKYTYCNLVFK